MLIDWLFRIAVFVGLIGMILQLFGVAEAASFIEFAVVTGFVALGTAMLKSWFRY